MQKGSDVMRSFGLGAIPTTLAAGYEGARALRSGITNDQQAGYIDEQGKTIENPFATREELDKASGLFEGGRGTKEAVGTMARNTAGLASWATLLGL